MFSKSVFAASLIGLSLVTATHAATLTYVLSLNDNGTGTTVRGQYAVYGYSSAGDNSGIASYNFTVTGQNTTVNRAPQARFVDENGVGDDKNSGYILLRATGGSGVATTGSFDTVSGNGLIVYGVGQRVGNVRTEGAALAPPGYEISGGTTAQGAFGVTSSFTTGSVVGNTGGQVPVLLGSGTFNDVIFRSFELTLSFGLAALFNTPENGSASIPTIVGFTRDLADPPEPAGLALLGVAGVGLIARRRSRSSPVRRPVPFASRHGRIAG